MPGVATYRRWRSSFEAAGRGPPRRSPPAARAEVSRNSLRFMPLSFRLLHVEDENAVSHARWILAARRLKRHAPAIRTDDRVGGLVALVLAPVRHPGEVLA